MFRGSSTIRIETNTSKEKVINELAESFETVGSTSISSSGNIVISNSRFNGFAYTTEIEGRLNDRDGTYTINIDYQAKPDIIAWIIGICLFPIGLAVFMLPYNAKGEMQRQLDRILEDIRYDLSDKR